MWVSVTHALAKQLSQRALDAHVDKFQHGSIHRPNSLDVRELHAVDPFHYQGSLRRVRPRDARRTNARQAAIQTLELLAVGAFHQVVELPEQAHGELVDEWCERLRDLDVAYPVDVLVHPRCHRAHDA